MDRTKEGLIERIRKTFKSPLQEHLVSQIKLAIRIQLVEGIEKDSKTKIGGVPWIKEGESWPRSEHTGKPLLFLLQFELEKLNQIDIGLEIPTEGIVSFYFDSDDWEGGLVKYYALGERFIKAEIPEEYYKEESRKKMPIWKRIWIKQESFRVFDQHGLEFCTEYQVPSYDSIQVRLFELKSGKRVYDYLTYDTALEENFLSEQSGNHHLFGYYLGDQESTYELYALSDSKNGYKDYSKNSFEEASNWRVLLKLGSDPKTQMNWIDAGNLLFFIKSDDLQSWNLGNIRSYLDTT